MQDPKNSKNFDGVKTSPKVSERVYSENRRRLLQMGAAGMPMVLTLRASATEAVVSQLRCLFNIPSSYKILVDDEGRAWVGTSSIKTDKNGYKEKDITKFKDEALYVFGTPGTAPEQYRPEGCSSGGDGSHGWGDDDDDGWGDDEASAYNSAPTSDQYGYTASDNMGRGGGGGSHGWGDDDDDSGHSHTSSGNECQYNLYDYSSGYMVEPGEHVSEGGSWSYSGHVGLYLALSLNYADQPNAINGTWPGISCIVSVLNYIGS